MIAVAVVIVLVGCCINVVFLELIISADGGAGNLITFFQFLFISAEGFVLTVDFGRKRPNVPLRMYAALVILFFSSSVINNWSLKFNIPMPLHMVFKAGSLVTNMIMGMLILKKRHSLTKYVSVAMVSVGIYICTYTTVAIEKTAKGASESNKDSQSSMTLITGIALLAIALVISSGLGIFQETLYKRHGKHSKEAMFYTHAMSLPFFTILMSDIANHVAVFNGSDVVLFGSFVPAIPKLWLYLMANVITQYICVRAVFVLTSECSSLTVTLVVTLRKFLSLIFSVIYFRNPFTVYHWIGSMFTFIGSLLFTGVHSTVMEWLQGTKQDKEKIKVDDADNATKGDIDKLTDGTRHSDKTRLR
ncbi:nucleotide sugar transporter SLC35B4-like isoform X2 [Corticium candelabrum]|uniref:nucleotide sugar transporter SLC35B4-like isoform X2 n=1 Tax=Corticium candelabrum TaxID=121492 RepID=UPI002E26B832|nr:nucleotide sugar transporter SLC35B4-like isoform X2 [Corticium candelabrum]